MLQSYETLTVRQAVEMLQVFTGLEGKNRYRILDPGGNEILYAYEESGFWGRQLLGGHRPLELKFIDSQGQLELTARRNFYWFFSHLELVATDGSRVGRMERRFKLIGRRFDLYDDKGIVGSIEGPLLRPNTFWVRQGDVDLAKITKRWSGLSREVFTAADTFQVEFLVPTIPERLRWVILGAAFAIDLDFFESRSGRGFIGFGGLGGGSYGPGGVSGRGILIEVLSVPLWP